MNSTPPHVRLANDVAVQFAHRPADEAAGAVARHLRMFWDPRMRRALLAHVEGGGVGLEPVVISAVGLLREKV